MKKINLNRITMTHFKKLMNNLDIIGEGENLYLRMWGGCAGYILNDNGDMTREFKDLKDFMEFLIQRENEVKSGVIKPIEWK